jgi:hypothetical protein
LQYIGHYNEFQRGALAKYHHNKISKDFANHYISLYVDWQLVSKDKKQLKES